MAKRRASEEGIDSAELGQAVEDLREEVRVLRDAVDELRSELQWIANNGEPLGEWQPRMLQVRQMAADPCAADWSDRLVVEQASSPATPEPPLPSESSKEPSLPSPAAKSATTSFPGNRKQSELF